MAGKKNVTEFDVSTLTDADIEALDRKFEKMSAEGAREMAKNYGAPDAKYDEDK